MLRVEVRSHAKGKVLVVLNAFRNCVLSLLIDLSIVHNFHELSLAFNVAVFISMGRFGGS